MNNEGLKPTVGESTEMQELTAQIGIGGPNLCFQCVADFKHQNPDATEDDMMEGFGTPEAKVFAGITLVPSWQQKQVGPSLVIVGLAMPTCYNHIAARKKTPEEKAIEGGFVLPGSMG